jgi:predicted DNA-binding protein
MESKESGVPKSTLILLAIENYIREKEAFVMMADMGQLVAKIDELEKAVQRKGLE